MGRQLKNLTASLFFPLSFATHLLQAALRRYNSDELGFTGTVENAISRLELKRETLAAERNTLEHDRLQVAEPLEQPARVLEVLPNQGRLPLAAGRAGGARQGLCAGAEHHP